MKELFSKMVKPKYCLWSLIVIIVLLFCLCACGPEEIPPATPPKVTAVRGNILQGIANEAKAFIIPEPLTVVENDYEIYGNIENMTERDFREIVANGGNKVYIHYQTSHDLGLGYDALIEIKTDQKTYSYQFVEAASDKQSTIITGVRSFLNMTAGKYQVILGAQSDRAAIDIITLPKSLEKFFI